MLYRGRLKDEGFLISWSNFIMVPCAAFNAGELKLMWMKDGTRVLPHWTVFEQKLQSEWGEWVPRLDSDLENTSAAISGYGIEAEPQDKPVLQNMIGKKVPSFFLGTFPRDLNALTSSRYALGRSIVSDSCTWWDRQLDFSGFRGVLSTLWNSTYQPYQPLSFSLLSLASLCLTDWANGDPGALCGCFVHRFSLFLSAAAS